MEDCSCYQCGAEVGGEVVMEEELTRHGEEGEVVVEPCDHEEAARVVEAVAGGYLRSRESVKEG